MPNDNEEHSFLFYGGGHGTSSIRVLAEDEDTWLTQKSLSEVFDTTRNNIHGEVPTSVGLGRGGFTLNEADNYKFKIPQLYNLADSRVLGHGASFSSIREVIKYKNEALPQNENAASNLDQRFVPLGLSVEDISQLTAFLTTGLHDPNLDRYEPDYVPSGSCITVDAQDGLADYRCNYTAP